MSKFKRSKLFILSTLLIVVGCDNSSIDGSDYISSEHEISVSEDVTSEPSTLSSADITSSESSSNTPSSTTPTSVSSEPPSSVSSEKPSSSESSNDPSSSSEIIREPGIYLERERIGVAIDHTITIEHEVYPSTLGSVTWEFVEYIEFENSYNYADLSEDGEITGLQFTSNELLIKGMLDDFEVYLMLMIFFDYDKHVDTFYPDYVLSSAVGRGNRYHNGTTMYARISQLRNVHYYAYDLKAA